MSVVSRRTFVSGLAGAAGVTITLPQWLKRAQAQGGKVRYDVATPAGKAMLKKYARAVQIMNDRAQIPVGDGKSWTFQWYIHAVRGDTTKEQELNRIYPNPTPQRQLAQETWWTCLPHTNADDTDWFLPWHRVELFCFEEIIRGVLGDEQFTLPYWNYAPNNAAARAIPEEFRPKKGAKDPEFGSLFRENRNDGVNDGMRIDEGQPADLLGLGALQRPTFRPLGADPGVTRALQSRPHNVVHGLIGNGLGMGSPPWAANDPIFWMHHCNLDRLWESWNRGGGENPCEGDPWRARNFVFAGRDGTRVAANTGQFERTDKVGYTYDRFENGPAKPVNSCNAPAIAAAAGVQPVLLARAEIAMMQAPLKSVAAAPAAAAAGAAPTLTGDLIAQQLNQNRNLYLVLENVRSKADSSIIYRVFLDQVASTGEGLSQYVDSFNFFDDPSHADHGAAGAAASATTISLPLTAAARQMSTAGLLNAGTGLTVRIETSSPAAPPVLGTVTLASQ
jgi:tyrosinase